MSTQTTGSLLFGIQSIAYVALCYVLPFRFVLRTGRFGRGILLCWASASAFTFFSAMLGQFLNHHVDKTLVDSCFDGSHVLAMLLMGWWQGLIISGIALALYRRRQRLSGKSEVLSQEPAT